VLTPRQKMILSAVVEEYIRLAEPVGSRALSKQSEIKLSPATIRNEMADLEELGYLDQPHTSAGRVPSQKGYRFYVDHLLSTRELDPKTIETLKSAFLKKMNEVELMIQQTANVLSSLTHYTAIVLGPRFYQDKIQHIQLVPLGYGKAVAILVTDTGHVESRQVQLTEDISSDDVVRLVNLLNHRLSGTPMSRLRSHMYREIAKEMAHILGHYEDALAVLEEIASVATAPDERVYVGGTTNILSQPEFRDVEKVKPLLEMLESSDRAAHVLPAVHSGIQVTIGQENALPPLQDCTVISATYSIRGEPVGRVGVLGPTRMNYARVMQILGYVSTALSQVLDEQRGGS
jgi:heat-inducible transcriptional repressor